MGIKDIMLRSGTEGMQTFDQNLFELYVAGQVDYDEALRQADSANHLRLTPPTLRRRRRTRTRLFDRISDLNLMLNQQLHPSSRPSETFSDGLFMHAVMTRLFFRRISYPLKK